MRGLVELRLEKMRISDRGLSAISSYPSLEVLHLIKTFDGDNGWRKSRTGSDWLSAIARGCPNLQELVLVGVNPTLESLGLVTSSCRKVKRLTLGRSEIINDDGMYCVASECLALKELCIKRCPISDLGMEILAGGCPSLVKLKVKKCRSVTYKGLERLKAMRESVAVYLNSVGVGVEQMDTSDDDGQLRRLEEQISPSISSPAGPGPGGCGPLVGGILWLPPSEGGGTRGWQPTSKTHSKESNRALGTGGAFGRLQFSHSLVFTLHFP